MPADYPFAVDGNEFKGQTDIGDRRDQRHGRSHCPQADDGWRFCRDHRALNLYLRTSSRALFVLADICTAQGVQEVVDRLLRNWGGIDILVNWSCAPRPQFTARVARDDRSRSFRDSRHRQQALYFAFL